MWCFTCLTYHCHSSSGCYSSQGSAIWYPIWSSFCAHTPIGKGAWNCSYKQHQNEHIHQHQAPNMLRLGRHCLMLSRTGCTVSRAGLEGTVEYCAPEVLRGEPYTEKCDIWSYGIVLWELFNRQRPYADADCHIYVLIQLLGNGSLTLVRASAQLLLRDSAVAVCASCMGECVRVSLELCGIV